MNAFMIPGYAVVQEGEAWSLTLEGEVVETYPSQEAAQEAAHEFNESMRRAMRMPF